MSSEALFAMVALLAGGLGLFLYGVQLLSDGLRDLAGPLLRRVLARATRHTWLGLLIGIAITALLQSSSAASVMMVSLLEAGLLRLDTSIALLLGTGVGATVTTQIVTVDWLRPLALPAIGAGALTCVFARRRRLQLAGKAVLGFGLLFYGFGLMRSALAPWQESLFTHWFAAAADAGAWAVPGALLAGTLFTATIQSSGASVGLVVVLAGTNGGADLKLALPFVVGCNVGTAVTAILAAAGGSRAARRAAWMHAGVRVIGGALAVAMLPLYQRWLPNLSPDAGRQIAHFHTLQNLVASLALLPFCRALGRLASLGLDPARDEGAAPRYLDFMTTPGTEAAAETGRLEVIRCANLAGGMIHDAIQSLSRRAPATGEAVLQREKALDALHATITTFLMRPRATPGPADEREINLLQVAHHIERVGDHAENLVELARLDSALTPGLDVENRALLGSLGEAIAALSENLMTGLDRGDPTAIERAARLRDLTKHDAQRQLDQIRSRLRAGTLGAIPASILEDALHNLVSAATHLKKATLAAFGRPAGLDELRNDEARGGVKAGAPPLP